MISEVKVAMNAISDAIAKAEQMGIKVCIAVVDSGANLIAFARMDGAWLGSSDVAIKKAKTAIWFQCSTGDLPTQPGQSLYGLEHSNGGLICFPGGVLLQGINGAIGVSGSSVQNDEIVAEYAAND